MVEKRPIFNTKNRNDSENQYYVKKSELYFIVKAESFTDDAEKLKIFLFKV
jgi:hypothetical protein